MIHWTASRKAEVLAEIDAGLPEAEAMAKHELSPEELAEWRRRLYIDGVRALQATTAQSLGRAEQRRKQK